MDYKEAYKTWLRTGHWPGPKVLIDGCIPAGRCQYCGGYLEPDKLYCSDHCRYNHNS